MQNSEFSIQNQDALYETMRVGCFPVEVRALSNTVLSVEDSDLQLIEDRPIKNLMEN